MNTRNLIRSTVRAILESHSAYRWQKQGLGMLRLYLTPETRLHVWDSRLRVPNVSTIHDHPWDFRSYIVSGGLVNARYREGAGGPCWMECFRTRIRCGPSGCAVEEPRPTNLLGVVDDVYGPGDWYEQRADEIHESRPAEGSVTLVERHFRADTEHANVYHATPTWVSAEPGPATPDEVAPIIATALEGCHPGHPLMLPYTSPLAAFDVTRYGVVQP